MEEVSIQVIKKTSSKTGKDFEVIEVKIGKWSKWIFVSDFELDYIKSFIK